LTEPRTPEEAAAAARARARARVAGGEYADAARLEALDPAERPGLERLRAWAVIDVDPQLTRSTRRGGAPITATKRLLLRMLRQYHGELLARMTRFNLHLLGYVGALEDRAGALEQRAGALEDRAGALEERASALEERVRALEDRVGVSERRRREPGHP
jgi:hypothetical protein